MKKNSLEERVDDLREFIKRESEKLKIILPNHIDHIKIDPRKVYTEDKLNPIIEIIKSKGGEIVEGKYSGARAKIKVKCSNGHIWDARPYHLKAGVWCPYCSGNIKLDLKELKAIAKQRGGQCLSKEYINNRTKLRWKCQRGHEWEATPAHVKDGTWCPFCAGNRPYSIEFFKALAEELRGQCLSVEYISIHTKLKWRCEEGHEWMATPNSVKRGSWCPICARTSKRQLE